MGLVGVMTVPFVIGKNGLSGFPFHLRFQASSWETVTDELEVAIKLLEGYRKALLVSLVDDLPDVYWGRE